MTGVVPEQQYTIPWPLKSHVHPSNIDRTQGEMLLLPNFRLPTLSTRGRPTANGFMKSLTKTPFGCTRKMPSVFKWLLVE